MFFACKGDYIKCKIEENGDYYTIYDKNVDSDIKHYLRLHKDLLKVYFIPITTKKSRIGDNILDMFSLNYLKNYIHRKTLENE